MIDSKDIHIKLSSKSPLDCLYCYLAIKIFKAFISDERLASQKLYSVLNSLAAQCIINRGGGLFTVNLLQVCEVDKLEFLRAGVRWNEEFWPGFTTDPKVIFQR